MSTLERVVDAAVAQGVVVPDAALPARDPRPWPVVLMIGLGAWLATIPLLIAIGMLFGSMLLKGPMPYVVGVLMLGLAVVIFRAGGVPIFVEQLALPALLVGGGVLAFGLFKQLPPQLAAAVLGAIAVGIGIGVERTWVRQLLGVTAATLFTVACVSDRALNLDRGSMSQFWLAWHLTFAIWLGAQFVQRQLDGGAGSHALASAIESIGAGWLLAVLAGLAWWSGMTFLAGGMFERSLATDIARELSHRQRSGWGPEFVQPLTSVAFAAVAAWWAARSWPSFRESWAIALAAVILMLAWFMPSLGAVLLALVICITAQRWVLAGTAAVAAAWIIGAFYYQLAYPLTQKALILFAAGALLAIIAWFAIQVQEGEQRAAADANDDARSNALPSWVPAAGIVVTLVLTLAVANFAIWQKEDVIANGKPVYVELVPVDPRSLMQGDYMALNFRVPSDSADGLERLVTWSRPHAVARVDDRGVATLVRIEAPDVALRPQEMRIELTPKNGRWILVTDAWFFREGDGERWSKAKYGEFRVTPDGRALLVGMADGALKPIRP
jgi:uncharacterized membrane-anchored protein